MGETRPDPALNILEISGLAWAATVHKAVEAMGDAAGAGLAAYQQSAQAQATRDLTAADAQALDHELKRAGIVDGHGVINPQWVLAVGIAASAPVKAAMVVQSQESSVHTEVGLAAGRGVGISYHRRIRPGADGVAVTEVRNAVEVSFFSEENAWAAMSRHLPHLAAVPAPPAATPVGSTPGESVENATHTIHLEVSAYPTAGVDAQAHTSRQAWAVADSLYSVGTGSAGGNGPAVAAVPPGDIGREFAWRLLGAREYLASAATTGVQA